MLEETLGGHLHHPEERSHEAHGAAAERHVWTAPRTWVTGESLTSSLMNTHVRDNLLAAFPAGTTYTAYTPTWQTSGTAPSYGNAVIVARYLQVGKLVNAYGKIAFGSSTTYGTNQWFFALPVAPIANMSTLGSLVARHSATGAIVTSVGDGGSGQAAPLFASTFNGAENGFTNTQPFAWASGDSLEWDFTYEAA